MAAATSIGNNSIHTDSNSSTFSHDQYELLNPPQGLESQYHTIFNLLSGCILEKNNPVAFLIGPRGCGKHFVLDACLQSLQKRFAVNSSLSMESRRKKQIFRIVRLSGLLLRGDDAAAGREIVHQLSCFATISAEVFPSVSSFVSISEQPAGRKKRQRDGSISTGASFHFSITLLDEILQRSRIDGIPILIVISDVEAFASGSSTKVAKQAMTNAAVSGGLKQILLYYLLDMASSEKTFMGVVAITTRLNFFDMLEKRIRSRAFGAQAVVQFTKRRDNNADKNVSPSSITNASSSFVLSTEYKDLIVILTEHLRRYYLRDIFGQKKIIGSLQSILLNHKDPICSLFYRQLSLGKSVRWFIRVLNVSYSIMMGPYHLCQESKADPNKETKNDSAPHFTQQDLLDGLVSMGCDVTEAYKQGIASSLLNGVTGGGHHDSSKDKNKSRPRNSSTAGISKTILLKASNNPRVQQLYDVSASQLVLLLSARRIIVKDFLSPPSSFAGDSVLGGTSKSLAHQIEVDYNRPLTFERMYKEYHDKFVKAYSLSSNNATSEGNWKSGGAATFSSLIFPHHVLMQSFLQLLECDIFRPSLDHTGGGLASYDFAKLYSPLALAGEREIACMPVHLTIEIDEELTNVLQQSDELVECSTVLREWGMKCIA